MAEPKFETHETKKLWFAIACFIFAGAAAGFYVGLKLGLAACR